MPDDSAVGSTSALRADDGQVTPAREPGAARNRATNRPVTAPALHHTTFTTKRLDEMVAWYELAVGMIPVFYGEDAAWLTNDEANHRIAFLSPPGLKHPEDKGHTTGIHHTAFEFKTFDQWLDNYTRLRDHGVLPFLSLDHGITMSVYYQDPDGNGVEIQVDGFGDWADSKQWIASSLEFARNPIGTFFNPDKLVEARESGLTFQEIHDRARAGDYLPEKIPEDIFLPELY
jgi:catechol 2,3-dioxygenase